MSEVLERQLVQSMRERLEQDVEWHLRHNSGANLDHLLDIAMKHESERIDRLIEKFDAEGSTTIADALEEIREEVLPAVIRELRMKR